MMFPVCEGKKTKTARHSSQYTV